METRKHILASHLLNFAFFLFLTLFILPKCRADCDLLAPVKPADKKREIALLNTIKPLNGLVFDVEDTIDGVHYKYKLSICNPLEGAVPNAGAVQIDSDKNHTLGKVNMVDVMGGTDWILLTYYGGDAYHYHAEGCTNTTQRSAKIMIVCDPDVFKGKLQILEERKSSQSNCFYLFELGSNVSCTPRKEVQPPSKLSSGSVFCILFFTVISIYLVCGFLYKRIVIGAQGLEQIPNYSFWRDFGNLQADGCDYFCRCGPRRESQAYRGIDDHLKDEERDDQLLNM